MKNLIIAVLAVSLLGCGDDTKKAASTNVESNNTTSNNTTSNNTTSNNTTTLNNTTSDNNVTVDVPEFDLGNDNDPISSIDVANACEKTQAYFAANVSDAEAKEFGCLLTGAFTAAFGDFATDSEVQTACADAYDACLAEPADPNPMETCDLAPTNCAADIGLVEQCIQGQVEGLKTIATSFTCADMTLDSDPDSEISITPSACDQLETECPDFFGAGE